MKSATPRALPLYREESGLRIKAEKRQELVRLLAGMLLQALQSERTKPGEPPWKKSERII